MNNINQIHVYFGTRKVGMMATVDRFFSAFEYDQEWLQNGFSISPLSLPLEKKLFIPKIDPFDGLFGVFSDSLPDGWGRLLVDRLMLKYDMNPRTINQLTRLAIVADSGMGALTYRPEMRFTEEQIDLNLDEIAAQCARILDAEQTDDLDELFRLGGSSGGARPKILTKVAGEDWIIKFPSTGDGKDIGLQEYEYSLCAKECGIDMEETRLFPSNYGPGYFGTKRFDRIIDEEGNVGRKHMLTASALLETSHRVPNLDYGILMQLTKTLTSDVEQLLRLFRLMCFNVYAHNRDDHSKNFSYIYEESTGDWRLSPAYDLTYSYSLGGEHATTINGSGLLPSDEDIMQVAKKSNISAVIAKREMNKVKEIVFERLRKYLE